MHFSTVGLVSALLVSFAAGAPADFEARSPDPTPAPTAAPVLTARDTFGCEHEADPDGAEGFCPAIAATGWCVCSDSSTYAVETGDNPCGYTAPPAAGPTTIPSTNCNGPATTSAPVPVATSSPTPSGNSTSPSNRNKCSQKECPKFCDRGSDNAKRSMRDVFSTSLTKRFYENPDPDQFPYLLLDQSYTRNICPTTPATNTYIWKKLSTQRGDYAAALQGLSGCTTIIVASGNGVFSSHIWEEDTANTPARDLQPANYQSTLTDMKNALSPNKDDLSGGEAFLIIPVDPDNTANYLYGNDIVNAMKQAISDASGITPAVTTYVPLDFETSTELGENKRGTASFEFDPAYDSNGQTSRAYRVISEGTVLSLKTNL